MQSSCHYLTDKYGYKYAVTVSTDDLVVFDSAPSLEFDIKEHGLRIVKNKNPGKIPVYTDYDILFKIEDDTLYFTALHAHMRRFPKPPLLFGVEPHRLGDGKWSAYDFCIPMTSYTGTLSVGREFDTKFYPKNDYTHPIPFCPEVYKQNGYIKIENGRVTEKFIAERNTNEEP